MGNKESKQLYDRQWYAGRSIEQKAKIGAVKLKRKQNLRKWVQELKSKMRCETCDENDWRCLDFHHESDKVIEISSAVNRGYSRDRILEEIHKCKILCANCHRKLHKSIRP